MLLLDQKLDSVCVCACVCAYVLVFLYVVMFFCNVFCSRLTREVKMLIIASLSCTESGYLVIATL